MVESSDKTWSTGEATGKPFQHSCFENPMNSMKVQKDMTVKDEPPPNQVSRYPICYWKEQRNSSRKNEEAGPKCRQLPVVAVSARESKLQCYKEQCCTGTRNVRSMNQGELDAVKQKTARVNTDILGISELNWMVKGKFHSDDHYIHHCRQESLRRNGVALIIDKRT